MNFKENSIGAKSSPMLGRKAVKKLFFIKSYNLIDRKKNSKIHDSSTNQMKKNELVDIQSRILPKNGIVESKTEIESSNSTATSTESEDYVDAKANEHCSKSVAKSEVHSHNGKPKLKSSSFKSTDSFLRHSLLTIKRSLSLKKSPNVKSSTANKEMKYVKNNFNSGSASDPIAVKTYIARRTLSLKSVQNSLRSTNSVSSITKPISTPSITSLQRHSTAQSVNSLNNFGKNDINQKQNFGQLAENLSTQQISSESSTITTHSSVNQTKSKPFEKFSQPSNNSNDFSSNRRRVIKDDPNHSGKEKLRKKVSSSREKKLHRHFQQLPKDEKLINYFSCAFVSDILLQGNLYITDHHFAFYSNVFGYVTRLIIPTLTVIRISKEKTAKIIPNAIGITTNDERYVFSSFIRRDSAYQLMSSLCQSQLSNQMLEQPEITTTTTSLENESNGSGMSDHETRPMLQQSSESENQEALDGGDRDAVQGVSGVAHETTTTTTTTTIPTDSIEQFHMISSDDSDMPKASIAPPSARAQFEYNFKISLSKFLKIPNQLHIIYLGVFLIIFLAMISGFLFHKILQIDEKIGSQRNPSSDFNWGSGTDDDILIEALRWKKELQTKSVEEIQNIVKINLEQIAKVRRSLETLSMLIIDRSRSANSPSTSDSGSSSCQCKN